MKIFVCDDEPLIRKSLTRALQHKQHEVLDFEHGGTLLKYLNEASEKPDLIILDLLMPEKNGFEVLQELKWSIPVLIISAFSGTQERHFEITDYPHVIGFIKKPFQHMSIILQEIEDLYANHIRKI